MARYDRSQEQTPQGRVDLLRCEFPECARVWHRPWRPGPTPRFCSDACKQANHRARRALATNAARAAYLAGQERRRAAWRGWEAEQWLAEEQRRQHRAQASPFSGLLGGAVTEKEGEAGEDVVEARATVFFLAGLDDGAEGDEEDAGVSLPEAYQLAARRARTSPAVVGRQLLEAKRILQSAGRWD